MGGPCKDPILLVGGQAGEAPLGQFEVRGQRALRCREIRPPRQAVGAEDFHQSGEKRVRCRVTLLRVAEYARRKFEEDVLEWLQPED